MASQLNADVLLCIFEQLCNPHGLLTEDQWPTSTSRSSLEACSLVCRAWTVPAQLLVFRTLNLKARHSWPAVIRAFDKLRESLSRKGVLVEAITRTITVELGGKIVCRAPMDQHVECIAQIARKCAALRSVHVTLLAPVRGALLSYIPRLRRLSIRFKHTPEGVDEILSSLPKLSHIELDSAFDQPWMAAVQPATCPRLRSVKGIWFDAFRNAPLHTVTLDAVNLGRFARKIHEAACGATLRVLVLSCISGASLQAFARVCAFSHVENIVFSDTDSDFTVLKHHLKFISGSTHTLGVRDRLCDLLESVIEFDRTPIRRIDIYSPIRSRQVDSAWWKDCVAASERLVSAGFDVRILDLEM